MATTIKILLIDDEKWTLDGMHMSLDGMKMESPPKFKISWAKSCIEAFKKIEKEKFDVILMDLMMPVPNQNGYQCMRQLMEKNVNIPVIFVTAVDKTDACSEAFRLGAADYVTKPLDFPYLIRKIIEVKNRNIEKENVKRTK